MKTLKKIMSLSIVICFIFNTASPAFAVSDLDILRSMIKQIEYTDIMDDEAVLSIGNDIERANEIYNSLSLADKERLTTAKSSMLEAYVERMAEILSMRTISASPRAATDNTYTRNGIAYYEHDGFYTRCGPPGSANVYLDGKMYIRTSNSTDTCKSISCVLPGHSYMHNKSIAGNLGTLIWSGKVNALFGVKWVSGMPVGQLGFQFTIKTDDESGDRYATSSPTFHYGSQKLTPSDLGGLGKFYIGNLMITVDSHREDRMVTGDINLFLANGGWIEADLWSQYYPYTAKVIVAKDESIFDNTPPTVPTISTKPVGQYYVNPIEMEDNTKNAFEFLGYSTFEEIEEEKKDRLKHKVLSENITEYDVLYKLIRNIGRTDIMDDEAVLSIGNEIERAYEIYNSLSAEQQELLPATETSLLMAYVERMTEILSMRANLVSVKAVSDLPDTIIKDGILYYKMPTTFMYKRKDSFTDTWTRNIPLNIVAYSRFNGTNVCSSLTCNDTTHGHNRVTTHNEGMLPNNNNSPASFSCYIGYAESNAVSIMKSGVWDSESQGTQDTWTFYSSGHYLLNGTTYPLSAGTTIGTHKFSYTGSSGWGGVALLGDLQELFNMGGLMKIASTFNTNYFGNRGTTRVIFGTESAFDQAPPTIPSISLTQKIKQVLAATLDWFSGDVEVSISGSTDSGGSGLKGYEYQIDGGAWQTYTAPFTVNATCTVNARAMDNANNRSANATKTINIDKVAPTAPVIKKSPTSEFASGDVTVTIAHGIDSHSGVARTEYQIDSGAWQTYTAPIVVSSTSIVKARTIDNVGLISPVSSTSVKIDRLAPSAPVIIKSPVGEFINSNVTITINGSTDTGGSALKGYEYQLNSGAWQSYTAPLTITATTSINARAVDNALNYSSISNAQVKIDRVAPSAPAIIKSPTREYANDDVTVVITSGIDDYSGVKRTEYQMNGGSWQTYTAPLVISSNTTIKARTIDNANNISSEVSEEVKIDRIAPSAPVIIKSPADEFASGDVTITINGSTDTGGSGLKNYEYQLDGGAWQAYTTPLTITATTSINARAVDDAINYSSVSTEEVKIDRIAPTMPTITKSTTTEFANDDVTVSITSGIDDYSGVASTEYQLNSGSWIEYTTPLVISSNTTIKARTIDNANNISSEVSEEVKIDRIAPSAPVIIKSPADEFASDDVTITINGSTDTGGSGLKNYEYQLDSGAWQTYTAPLTITSTASIKARAVDNALNYSPISTEEAKIDRTSPIVHIDKTPDDWTNGSVTISIQAEDDVSGLKSFAMTSPSSISVDMGSDFITTTSASFVVDKNAIYSFIIENHAGLQVKFNSTVDKIEDLPPTPPKVDESGEGTPPPDPTVPDHIEKDWANAPIELPVTSDAPSGIKKFQYIIEENTPSPLRLARSALKQAWIDYEGAVFKVEKEGIYTLRVRSVSNAGNISDVSTYLIKNDYTAPTATHEFKDNKAVITADDTLSGIGKITCSHGEILSNIIECEVQAGSSHDYMIYDTAGNVLGYSIEKAVVAPPPSSGGNGDNYEYPPIVPKDEPKKDIEVVKPVPSKPIEKVVPDSDAGEEEIFTSTNSNDKIKTIKPPEHKKDTGASENSDGIVTLGSGINWWLIFFLILIIIATAVLIREIFNNKGEDKNDVR